MAFLVGVEHRGGELLVRGASRLAVLAGLSPLVIGLTVVAFGTSSPELAVSLKAALAGNANIALGNVVGSNIFNVLFILGISALIVPLVVHAQLIRQEIPIMLGASLLLLALGLDGSISIWEGALLLALLVAYTSFLVIQSRKEGANGSSEFDEEFQPAEPGGWDAHWAAQVGLIVVGLVLLVVYLSVSWLISPAMTVFAFLSGAGVLAAPTPQHVRGRDAGAGRAAVPLHAPGAE